jgi:hypothetical protein
MLCYCIKMAKWYKEGAGLDSMPTLLPKFYPHSWECEQGKERHIVNSMLIFRCVDMLCLYRSTRWRSGWGTALQTGRSRDRFPIVSLEFFIDITLPAALWSWSRLSLEQKWVPGIYPGGKGGRCVGLTILPTSCADFLKTGSINLLEPPGPVKAFNGIALPYLYHRCEEFQRECCVVICIITCTKFQLCKKELNSTVHVILQFCDKFLSWM